jgi:hypothetical protein
MTTGSNLNAGEWVEVLSKPEILASLDKNGRLDGLPFMPQMFQYCGRRFRVFKRAHKSCDTIDYTGGRRMINAVHLEGIRCDGEVYGGCQAMCLIFWKTAWLKRVAGPGGSGEQGLASGTAEKDGSNNATACVEADVLSGTRVKSQKPADDPVYVCQATRLLQATTPLRWWELSQYVEDYASGNVSLGRMLRGFLYSCSYNLIQSGIGLGPALRWAYDRVQAVLGGVPFPRKTGKIPAGEATPACTLNLQPGEWVRVKSHQEILATLNTESKNRGLYFDAEAVPFCGGTYRVLKRVGKILDEKTGKLIQLKNESIVLEGVFCEARYSSCRMYCPRGIYSFWREIWLERVEGNEARQAKPLAHDHLKEELSCDGVKNT